MSMPPITEERLAISRGKREFAQAAWREADEWDRQIGLTVVMEVDGLDLLDLIAWQHDGEGENYFVANLLPALARYCEAELWALAGFFLSYEMTIQARFIARYAGIVHSLDPGDPRPDPLADWAVWRFLTPEGGPRMPTSAEIAQDVAEALRDFVAEDDRNV